MKQKFFFIFTTFATCLIFSAVLATTLYAQEITIFLPIISDPSLHGEVLFYQIRESEADGEIMKVDLRTQTITQLTSNAILDAYPAWSPDRTKIVYSSWLAGNADLYVMDADGSNPTQLTNTPNNDTAPAWSPDGNQIAFTRQISDFNRSIFLLDLNTLTVTEVITAAYSPDWSPDGTRLAFASSIDGDAEIYIFDLNTKTFQQVTDNHYLDYQPVWSPDGTELLVGAMGRDSSNIAELYRINPDGTGQEFLSDHNYIPGAHDWSPDGTKIIYEGATKFSRELIVLRLATGEWESATVPDGPMFESSSRYGPQWK